MESDLEAAMKSVMESVPGFDKELLDILACPACRGPLAPWPSKDLFSREERTGRGGWGSCSIPIPRG